MAGPLGRFLWGASFVPRGAGALLRLRREVGRHLLLPLVLAGAAAALGTVEIAAHARTMADAIGRHAAVQEVAASVGLTALAGAAMVGGWLFLAVYLLLTGPFNDRVAERVERDRLGEGAAHGSLLGALRDLLHELPRLALYLAALGVLYLLSLASPIVLPVGSFLATARYLSYGALDFAMARRRYRFAAKRRFLARHRAATQGLGCALAALALVPGANLFVPALGAAGGTLLFLAIDAAAAGASSEEQSARYFAGK